MSKIRKNNSNSLDTLCAAYFYDITNYAQSRDKIYNEFEKEVYNHIFKRAENGTYNVSIALKVDTEKSFEWNMDRYRDIFDKLSNNLVDRGFSVRKSGNYFAVNWGSRNEGKKK